ncbi:threonine ammonia-lyase [Undibacterium terreum]|uniref:Serine/threonine dehydratase n=1 Tax=Undibacterium terreum TaxID=1224302 RepID=A0A916ULR2_9BURK|nr:threonine/serine dehydratase [Undibacterium terreum]GGC77157.1 serine/threonine dehydratase [Undibacterium terreum]
MFQLMDRASSHACAETLACTNTVTDRPASGYPTLEAIRQTSARLHGKALLTPVWQWQTGAVEEQLHPSTGVWLKLELFQKSGSFKFRAALNCLMAMDESARQRGVVAVSAGNHAVAVAYAARLMQVHAIVYMPRAASPARIAACREYGAEVRLATDVHEAFRLGNQLAQQEQRTLVHPFDGPLTAQGTATVGLELMQQVPGLDAVVVPIGGGGLCAGIAAAVKQINPGCKVFGVEPFGADIMYRSFLSGKPEKLDKVDTVADSLGAPYAMQYSMDVCRRFVDEVVRVNDDEICRAMHALFRDMKLAVEPAAAVATAGMFGPLRDRLDGKQVALIVCGSNMDAADYAGLLTRGSGAG